MTLRIKIPRSWKLPKLFSKRWILWLIASLVFSCGAGSLLFLYEYGKYQEIVNTRMSGPIFANTASIYAAPQVIRVGEQIGTKEIVSALHRAGYTEVGGAIQSKIGTYRLHDNSLVVMPGPESFYSPEGVRILFARSTIISISRLGAKADDPNLESYALEPQLVTGLYDQTQRSKRRLVTYDDVPKTLRDAILSIEDRRFFEHNGVNYKRLAKAVVDDIRSGQNTQGGGGSTLTMQFAKGYFLTNEKTVSRKMAQIMIALQLEQRFSKQQIFETYINWVPMGQRGSFSINGMGEAARAYFGKDLKDMNLQECALLAAIIQRPSYLAPFKHPERALERRNLVLKAMVATGSITREAADRAIAAPLKLAPLNIDGSDAPYFVDMVRESLLEKYKEEQLNEDGMRIYTTLDPDLQRAASEAIESGVAEVDELIRQRRTKKITTGRGKKFKTEVRETSGPEAQVALIALDPHTGRVLALAGGRNYGTSQLNHAIARRPTGSIFKPFVYAAALNSAINGAQPVFTQTTMLDDSESVYQYGNRFYAPRNFHNDYHGEVIARYALAHSLNNATVKLAEMVGYDNVTDLARSAGISSVKPTPAMALGAYDATPLEMAGAYTMFANAGLRIEPRMISSIQNVRGEMLESFPIETKQVLDPRVAYVTTHMMQEVLNSGTAVRVRSLGFTAQAAGKTGTSHDGWFAGYTNNVLCIVWVGFDDYSDLGLEGAHSAAPIWAAFMKKAVALPQYKDAKPFTPPPGVVLVNLDKATNLVSNSTCTDSYEAAFIEGTEPKETCDHLPVAQKQAEKKPEIHSTT
ncbi:MAG TPA: PBP1A family penicillin-binding protein [Candidatus Angelobacter sp.]|nr:PBP1A family penicillin-binding protein [Candidatus Angelobacter sp.]